MERLRLPTRPRAYSATLPPDPNFTGTFPVQYTVSDGTNSTIGVLNLTVGAVDHQPATHPGGAANRSRRLSESGGQWQCPGRCEQSRLTRFPTRSSVRAMESSQITDATTGALTYTPPFSSFFGLVQVTYTVTDGTNTTTGTVIINVEQTIQPKDDGPIVAVVGKPLTISAVDLLANDVAAPNGLKLSIGSVGNATNGTVVLNENGSVTFTPTAKGTAAFTYTDTDADSDASTVATVTLNVKLGPDVRWATPAAIVYGTALGRAQLDAIASVPGTFHLWPGGGHGSQCGARPDARRHVHAHRFG